MLFQQEGPDGADDDTRTIFAALTGFFSQYPDKQFDLNTGAVFGVASGMRQDFPHEGGLAMASPFKKAANFVVNWIAASPIRSDDLPHANARFALLVAASSLHGATLHGNNAYPPRTLEHPIEVSQHSLLDILDALSETTPQSGFKLVSVLLEQMAYKTNPECQYETAPLAFPPN